MDNKSIGKGITLVLSTDSPRELKGYLGDGVEVTPAQVGQINFDYVRKAKPTLYQIRHLDLSVARTAQVFEYTGSFLGVTNITSGASVSIGFNGKNSKTFTFDSEQQIEIMFTEISITNTAQANASCDLVIMIGGRYTPYYRTKAVSPTVTTASTLVDTITVPTTAGGILISAANALRRTVVLYNNDMSNTIYIGKNNTVTAANGLPIIAGTERVFGSPYYVGDIYAIASGAAVNARYWIDYE